MTKSLNAEQLAERSRQEAKRERIVDAYTDGVIDKAERDRRLAKVDDAIARLDSTAVVIDLRTLDWSKPPGAVNAVLRAMWRHVELGPDLLPVSAEWLVPEWRS